jgi:hypothetical protein
VLVIAMRKAGGPVTRDRLVAERIFDARRTIISFGCTDLRDFNCAAFSA